MDLAQSRTFVLKSITERRVRRKREYIKRQFSKVRTTEPFINTLVDATSVETIMDIAHLVGVDASEDLL